MILYDMKTRFTILLLFAVAGIAAAQEFNQIPKSWKWLSDTEVVFSYDASYTDTSAFSIDASSGARRNGVKAPEKFVDFPIKPVGAINLTYSPDSTMLASPSSVTGIFSTRVPNTSVVRLVVKYLRLPAAFVLFVA